MSSYRPLYARPHADLFSKASVRARAEFSAPDPTSDPKEDKVAHKATQDGTGTGESGKSFPNSDYEHPELEALAKAEAALAAALERVKELEAGNE